MNFSRCFFVNIIPRTCEPRGSLMKIRTKRTLLRNFNFILYHVFQRCLTPDKHFQTRKMIWHWNESNQSTYTERIINFQQVQRIITNRYLLTDNNQSQLLPVFLVIYSVSNRHKSTILLLYVPCPHVSDHDSSQLPVSCGS